MGRDVPRSLEESPPHDGDREMGYNRSRERLRLGNSKSSDDGTTLQETLMTMGVDRVDEKLS